MSKTSAFPITQEPRDRKPYVSIMKVQRGAGVNSCIGSEAGKAFTSQGSFEKHYLQTQREENKTTASLRKGHLFPMTDT